jgi:hypothetical protein
MLEGCGSGLQIALALIQMRIRFWLGQVMHGKDYDKIYVGIIMLP